MRLVIMKKDVAINYGAYQRIELWDAVYTERNHLFLA